VLAVALACGCGDDGEKGGTTVGSASLDDGSSSSTAAETTSTTGTADTTGTTTGTTDTGAPDTGTTAGDSTGTDGSGTTGDPLGDCCIVHGTPGCSVPGIQECVCTIDAPCCVGAWDMTCVGEVEKLRCADCTP